MDPSQALSELGLAPPTSADAIRRAYLKAVRAHPPERDPEGFRRVRDAYEVLKDAPWFWQGEQPARVEEAEGIGRGELVPVGPGVFVRFAAASTEVASQPAASGDAGDFAQGPAEPSQMGSLSDDEKDHSSDGFRPAWHEVHEAMGAADYERAARLWLASMHSGDASFRPSTPPRQVLECVLGLFVAGKFRLGSRLLKRLETWAEHQGVHATEIGVPAAARWTLLKEIAALHAEFFEARVLRRLAKSVESGELSTSRDAVEDAQATDSTFLQRMSRLAPTLYAAVKPTAIQLGRRPKFRLGWWSYAWLGFLALQCLRGFATPSASSKIEGTRGPPIAETSKPSARPGEANAIDGVDGSIVDFRPATVETVIDGSIARGACNVLLEQWPLYGAKLRASGSTAGEAAYRARREAALAMCAELSAELPEKP